MVKPHKHIYFILVALAIFTLMLFTEIKVLVDTKSQKLEAFKKTEKIIREKELRFLNNSNNYFSDTINLINNFNQVISLDGNKKINISVFKSDSLLIWNSNLLNINKYLTILQPGTKFLLANNGFYLVNLTRFGTYTFVQFYQLKTNYLYQNQFIQNHFNTDLAFLGSAVLSPSPIKDFYNLTNNKGDFLFAIQIFGGALQTPFWLQLLIVLNIFLILWYFNALIKNLLQKNFWLATFLFFGLNLTVKWLLLKYRLPDFIYRMELFSADIYASSSFVPSLGDFFILACLVWWYFILIAKIQPYKPKSKYGLILHLVWISLLCMVITDSTFDSIKSLVFDSQISFDLNNIYSLNFFTFVALLLALILLLIAYQMCKRFYMVFTSCNLTIYEKIIYVSFVFYFVHPYLVRYLYERNAFYPIGSSALLLVFVAYLHFVQNKINRLQQYFILVTVLSLFISSTIQYWSAKEEEESRKLYAAKLVAQNDINTEYFLSQIESKIANDKDLRNYFNNPIALQSQLLKRLRQLYFTGYLSKYDISIYDFDSTGNYFRDRNPFTFRQINYAYTELSNPTISKSFKLLKNTAYLKGYLGKFTVHRANKTLGYLFIQLQPKLLQDENRFDELLIEGFRTTSYKKHSDYAYAIYRDNNLLIQSGNYAYLTTNTWPKPAKGFEFINKDNFNHLVYVENGNNLVVVSRLASPFYEPFGLFSLLFTFFTIVLVASLLLYYLINTKFILQYNWYGAKWLKTFVASLNELLIVKKEDVALIRSQIQMAVVLIVFVTLSATAIFTINLISNTYTQKQNDKLIKKLRGVVSSIETDILIDKNEDKIETDAYLNQIGDYYETDITLFNPQGEVVGSTINKLYSNGIIAPLMDAEAYKHLQIHKESQYTHTEQIATFKFTGAYLPIVNKSKVVIGFVMLPYFNKLVDLYAEISNIIVGFINLYALLFITIGVLAWLVSRNISYPLVLIQKQMAQTNLGKQNEPINWNKNDEIGQLVKQYNLMITELEQSAILLAQSEREGAWRDIARQIAHEIKNPLTPMKLSVQHLERAWNDKSPKLQDTFKRVTQTLITQIDTLSELAGEFSSYAKMPVPKFTQINLTELLSQQVLLHQQYFNGKIIFVEPKQELYVRFDEGFLNRTFTNLIKNAIQAIPEDVEGVVELTVKTELQFVVIAVTDNGTGIEDDKLEKVFTPYFSTKSFGMGLGLPIVKSMLQSGDGEIWFTTKPNFGTTFYVKIPLNTTE